MRPCQFFSTPPSLEMGTAAHETASNATFLPRSLERPHWIVLARDSTPVCGAARTHRGHPFAFSWGSYRSDLTTATRSATRSSEIWANRTLASCRRSTGFGPSPPGPLPRPKQPRNRRPLTCQKPTPYRSKTANTWAVRGQSVVPLEQCPRLRATAEEVQSEELSWCCASRDVASNRGAYRTEEQGGLA
jgi:hypothetical protein